MNLKNPNNQLIYSKMKPRLEHIALNVSDPIATAKWYCEHLGMNVMRKGPPPVNVHFISDAAGKIMFELYNNTAAPVLDFASLNPLCLHIAFISDDLKVVRDSLITAGAKVIDDITTIPNGDQILMMRDPWGLSIQFVKRTEPILK
jgi:predicted enzyme related to lactoylglutathione lyase